MCLRGLSKELYLSVGYNSARGGREQGEQPSAASVEEGRPSSAAVQMRGRVGTRRKKGESGAVTGNLFLKKGGQFYFTHSCLFLMECALKGESDIPIYSKQEILWLRGGRIELGEKVWIRERGGGRRCDHILIDGRTDGGAISPFVKYSWGGHHCEREGEREPSHSFPPLVLPSLAPFVGILGHAARRSAEFSRFRGQEGRHRPRPSVASLLLSWNERTSERAGRDREFVSLNGCHSAGGGGSGAAIRHLSSNGSLGLAMSATDSIRHDSNIPCATMGE